MKKMFLYDSEGYEVIACQLMEESRCGEPQLVVVTPGKPVTSLETFMDDNEMPIRLKKSFYSLDILLESLTFFHHAIIEDAEINLSIRIHFLGTKKDEVPESVLYMFDKIHFSHEK